MSAETVNYLLPEILLVLAATVVYVVGAFAPGRRWNWVALATLGVIGLLLATQGDYSLAVASVNTDLLARFGRWFALASGILLVMANWRGAEPAQTSEFVGSLLLIIAGMMLVAVASDLVMLFVALELISIPTYVLLYLGRGASSPQEAAAKYFYLSILSSAILLYGFSFIYGIAGSTHLPKAQAALLGQGEELGSLARLAPLAIVLVFAGLGFRMAAVPFQFYAPDVYQGTSHGNAAMLSVIPKAAGLIALVRIVGYALPGQESVAWRLAMILGALSMTLGNLLALWQNNLRRLLAYSSIAHVGYMMIGVAVGFMPIGAGGALALDGFGAMLFYLAIYGIATIGVFAAFAYLADRDRPIETVDDLAGVWRSHPMIAVALAVFMFSLAGIPLLAGFWGKLTLFFSALNVSESPTGSAPRTWFVALAVLGVVNAAIAAAYYLRIVATAVFREPVNNFRAEGGWAAWASAMVAAAATIAIGLMPGPLLRESNEAARLSRPARPAVAAESNASNSDRALSAVTLAE